MSCSCAHVKLRHVGPVGVLLMQKLQIPVYGLPACRSQVAMQTLKVASIEGTRTCRTYPGITRYLRVIYQVTIHISNGRESLSRVANAVGASCAS